MGFLLGYIFSAVYGIIIITIHGFLTAFFSYIQGDNTPKNNGMLSLNPAKHFEPLGFIFYVFFGYGWGQPVRTSSFGYKNRKLGGIITSLAPVFIGIIYGLMLMLFSGIISRNGLSFGGYINALGLKAVIFAIYNLIPVYPLNGHKLLSSVLSPNSVIKYNQYEKVLQLVLILLILMGILDRLFSFIITGLVALIAFI